MPRQTRSQILGPRQLREQNEREEDLRELSREVHREQNRRRQCGCLGLPSEERCQDPASCGEETTGGQGRTGTGATADGSGGAEHTGDTDAPGGVQPRRAR